MSLHAFRPEELPPWVLRTELPTVVRERCDSALQISVWLSIRWLLSIGRQSSRALGSREIADRAKINVKSVTGCVQALVELGLLEITGHEQIRGLRGQCPIYRIPRAIEVENAPFVYTFLAQYGESYTESKPEGQQALPLWDAADGGGIDPKTDQCIDPKTDHGREGGKIHGREGGSPPPAKKSAGRPASPPPAPPNLPPLTAHPTALWARACGTPRPTDPDQLATLAAAHDAPTGGYGWYWVGRAILAASLDADVRSLRKVRAILDRWQAEAAYGSDRYTTENRYVRRNGAGPGAAAAGPRAGADGGAPPVRAPVRSTLDY